MMITTKLTISPTTLACAADWAYDEKTTEQLTADDIIKAIISIALDDPIGIDNVIENMAKNMEASDRDALLQAFNKEYVDVVESRLNYNLRAQAD